MDIAGSVALVTGANRGLGAAFCRGLLASGAAKVYAGARDIEAVAQGGVVPVRLDVTSAGDIAAAAVACGDVTLLINNAGTATYGSVLDDDVVDLARREFEVNVLGPLELSRHFAPILAANGGGSIVNVLSVLSWTSNAAAAVYGASKAAAWSLTNALRLQLREQGTHVLAVHVALVDTDMTAGIDAPKMSPDDVVSQTLAGLEAGAFEVLADAPTRHVRGALSGELVTLYPELA